jgi:hypothetical protein
MSADRRRFPESGVRWSVNRVQPVDFDQQLGQVDLRQPGLDQLPQPPFVCLLGRVDRERAIGKVRLGGRVTLAGELLKELGLLAGERLQPLGAVDWLVNRLDELGAGLLPALIGQQQARRVGVPAATRHPHPAGAQRGA